MTVLVAGHARASTLRAVERAGERPQPVGDDVATHLRDGDTPRCILADCGEQRLSQLIVGLRSSARLFDLPVIALVEAAMDRLFTAARSMGADDVVAAHDAAGITRRVAALEGYRPGARPVADRGRIRLVDPTDHRRRTFGRVLRYAGFDVDFATTLEAPERSDGVHDVLVVHTDAGAPALPATRLPQTAPSDAPIVIVGDRDGSAREEPGPARLAADAPPDHVLFVINELLRPDVRELRSSPRVLFDTLCTFRDGREMWHRFGLTYNLSADGVYVRTMDPLPAGSTVWLELRPPDAAAVVHLRGEIKWVRGVKHGSGGPVPPGFGVQLVDGQCPPRDLAAYRDGYEQHAAGVGRRTT